MEDANLVNAVAREFVERHGHAAVAILHEQAEIAAGLGDSQLAQSWRDIAQAAADPGASVSGQIC